MSDELKLVRDLKAATAQETKLLERITKLEKEFQTQRLYTTIFVKTVNKYQSITKDVGYCYERWK